MALDSHMLIPIVKTAPLYLQLEEAIEFSNVFEIKLLFPSKKVHKQMCFFTFYMRVQNLSNLEAQSSTLRENLY